jgi:polyisoprenoid-binding protein YceI
MRIISLLLFLTLCSSVSANWTLNNEQSSLHFISTKNEHVSEIHSFQKLQGSLNNSGQLTVNIELASVETGIDIRNTRMKEMLFNVAATPKAILTAQLDPDWLSQAVGTQQDREVSAKLQLNGTSQDIGLMVQVIRLDQKTFQVSSSKPILVYATAFGLADGVASLQKIAGLAGISLAVPVTFNVQFVKAH